MTGAVVIVVLSLTSAAAVLAVLLATHRPPEGWSAWLRASLRAWRGDELAWREASADEADGGLGDLFRLSEPVSDTAYTRPEELRETLAAVSPRARRTAARP